MFNFNTGGGSFTPYINYMASIQGWEMSGEDGKQNFTFKQAVFDLNPSKLVGKGGLKVARQNGLWIRASRYQHRSRKARAGSAGSNAACSRVDVR